MNREDVAVGGLVVGGAVANATALVAVRVAVLWLAWNACMPALFGLPAVTLWQATALVAVAAGSTLLFSGMGA